MKGRKYLPGGSPSWRYVITVVLDMCIPMATYIHTQPEGTATCHIKKDKQLQMVCVNQDAVFVTVWVARSSFATWEVTAYRWRTATSTQEHDHQTEIQPLCYHQAQKKSHLHLKQKQKQRSHSPVYCWAILLLRFIIGCSLTDPQYSQRVEPMLLG